MYHVAGWVVAFLPTDAGRWGHRDSGGRLRQRDDLASALRTGRCAAARTSSPRAGRPPSPRVAAAARPPGDRGARRPGFFHHLVGMDGAQRSLATVRLLTSGTAPLDTDDFGAVQTLIGHPVWEGYGLSEAASVVASTLMTRRAAARIGRQAAVRHRTADRRAGRAGRQRRRRGRADADAEPVEPDDPLDVMVEAPDAGEVGRIAIRGATLFSGYWPDGGGGPAADGWFVTGDIGFLDDDGELHLVDRASETVTVAGFTVYPREVEQVLGQHPGVAEAAVIGVPGDGWRRGGRGRAGRPHRRGTHGRRSRRVRGEQVAGVQTPGRLPGGAVAAAHRGRPAGPGCRAAATSPGRRVPRCPG